jgi:hypothetical protein
MRNTIWILAFALTSSAQTRLYPAQESPMVVSIGDKGTVSIKSFGFLSKHDSKHDWDLKADFSSVRPV